MTIQRHTKGKLIYSTKMTYSGEFANDVICGEGEMMYGPECKYQGSWVNGLVRIIKLDLIIVIEYVRACKS